MGAIFGKTSVTVYGGYIEGNLYGGGRQSRLYAENSSLDNVATVLIEEQNGKNIAIKGSVFGGGDRGSSTTTNASVPTTIGNVLVTINGNSEGSKIYFVDGGVYGDGNLCLVSGYRKIEIVNFTLNADKKLKTFYSLQRADEVIIDNSDFVLLGAIDLVEEGDYTIYSINRIDSIKMENGSTIKLSRIVKLLGTIESDVDTDRKFISKGNNGKNDYSGHGEPDAITALKADEISSYINSSTLNGVEISKNTICVANGLYLEIKETETKYGTVKGLFTLELLYANPGEGGGFVYSDILSSTGDFICETVRAYVYNAVTDLAFEDFELNKYYVRKNARTYELATSYEAGLIYYTRQDNTTCMDVIDNVGGKLTLDKFEYYYWYIAGTVINYEVTVEGFIGSPDTSFEKESIIPEHKDDLAYIIFGITEGENQILTKALNPNTGYYTLVQKNTGLKDQEIAIEVFIGGVSAGYLVYENEKWGISFDNTNMFGYKGRISDIETNVLTCLNTQSPKNNVQLVLHKATTVNTEQRDLYFSIEVDIYKRKTVDGVYSYEAYTEGTSTLVFNTNVSIIRLVPVQSTYSDEARFYNGVGLNNENIRINGYSSITVEYQTAYIPLAYPYIEGTSSFDWMLSTLGYSYYFNMAQGTYLTMSGDTVINISGTLTFSGEQKESTDSVSPATVYKNSLGEYWYKDTDESVYVLNNNTVTTTKSVFPKGTKITLIDLTDDKNPKYFYYICMADVESINLNDFYLMGSNSIKLETYGSTFKKSYNDYQNLATRVTERLVFTFDFSNSTWNGNEFSGLVQLSHMYDNNTTDDIKAVDIMDYVNLVDSGIGNEKVYNRATPKAVGYSVLVDSHGVNDFIASGDTKIYEFGEEEFSVMVEENDAYIDTKYGEGEFAVKVELLDSLGNVTTFPEGLLFMVTDASGNNVYIGPDKDNIFAVIPFARYASITDGKLVCNLKVVNELYSLNKYKDSSGLVKFKLSLYSAADSHYLNYLETDKEVIVSFTLEEETIYSINGKLESSVISTSEART